MKCLILGGAGFLGSHLCDHLLATGHQVRVFDRFESSKVNLADVLGRIELIEGDFANHALVRELVAGVDVVYHLISTTVPKVSNDDPAFDLSTNLLPTLHLLDCARDARVKKVVFFSSGGTVYGIPAQSPIPETHPTNPICSYGIHKLAIEKYLHLYHHLYGLDYGVLRFANPFGPRQRSDAHQGAVAVFLGKILHDQPIEIWGDGTVVRDYLYVQDAVAAAEKILHCAGPHRVFNIGAGRGLSLLQLLQAIEAVIGRRPAVRFTESRRLDVPANVLDITLARRHLDWSPATNLHDAITQTWHYLSGK